MVWRSGRRGGWGGHPGGGPCPLGGPPGATTEAAQLPGVGGPPGGPAGWAAVAAGGHGLAAVQAGAGRCGQGAGGDRSAGGGEAAGLVAGGPAPGASERRGRGGAGHRREDGGGVLGPGGNGGGPARRAGPPGGEGGGPEADGAIGAEYAASMRLQRRSAEVPGIGILAIAIALLTVPNSTPVIGGLPTDLGRALLALGLLILIIRAVVWVRPCLRPTDDMHEAAVVRNLFDFLNGRRVLFDPMTLEEPTYVAKSVLQIRDRLELDLSKFGPASKARPILLNMRTACLTYLTSVPTPEASSRSWPAAINDLRAAMSEAIETLETLYGFSIPGGTGGALGVLHIR